MREKKHTVFEIDGVKTLPLYVLMMKAPEGGIPALGSANCTVHYKEPEYEEEEYSSNAAMKSEIVHDYDAALDCVKRWPRHSGNIRYYFQFKDDPNGSEMMVNFHRHTEIVSAICDSQLGIDTTPLWNVVHQTMLFKEVQAKYRSESDHDSVWDQYAAEIVEIGDRIGEEDAKIRSLIPRILNALKLRQFEEKKSRDEGTVGGVEDGEKISVFYSYSHADEALRNELEKHLSVLKREGFIDQWHDRQIEAGQEWEPSIDKNLMQAHIVLLLVSSDFLASNYCYETEMKAAMERHSVREARVIPIVLRSCDWSLAPFGKLQALPKDAMAVTSWENQDEAFTDVAKGLRRAVDTVRENGFVG
ncbi:toll/interleukin-1 receptor domain-containing protein [Roseiconus lacunae]|uniref:toll/interleukin-1 receptor domain-containing protein n=1 Tax=Roseiconus lacunae TaxID=2605694 RepID=UPI001E5275D4|nr:toll/interleukin-1 receptor domain-containing protein [Roseiconus lacunae]MCD0460077.1 toll/interleukin-1 receptor domain-containing protein [Roseiconus lacunae]